MIDRARIHNSIFFFSLLLLTASIPAYADLMNLAMIAMVLNWVVEGNFKVKLTLLKEKPLFMLFIAFYLLLILSLTYTQNLAEGLKNLEQKIMLMVFPLVISTSASRFTPKQLERILITFVGSVLLVSLICLGYGFYKFTHENTTAYLLHEGLTSLLQPVQPVYFALYVCFATAILLHFLVKHSFLRRIQIIVIVLILYFFIFVILTSARTATFALAVVLFAGGFYYSRKIKRLPAFLISMLLLLVVGVWTTFRIPTLKERVMAIVESKLYFDPNENNANGLTLRLVKWQCSLEGIKTNPLFGIGIGDTQDHLQGCYEQRNFWGRHYRYNSHNQYLQSALGLGVVGLLLLLACLAVPLWAALKTKNYLYVLFLVLMSLAFLTESVLERKQGIIFYAFLNSFLALHVYDRNKTSNGNSESVDLRNA